MLGWVINKYKASNVDAKKNHMNIKLSHRLINGTYIWTKELVK